MLAEVAASIMKENLMSIDRIDYAELYREQMRNAGWRKKTPDEWDKRAPAMSQRGVGGPYADDFIAAMNTQGASTLLDVGCGHGALCLPLAERFEQVHALDYSPVMLQHLNENAQALGIHNVQSHCLAWEDEWDGVPVCDILIASRSCSVADMDVLLNKVNRYARQRVYLSYLVGGRFVDHELTSLLSREYQGLPDYIYIINMLYQRNIHPTLSYIETPSRLAGTDNFEAFVKKVEWAMGKLDESETTLLRDWYQANPEKARQGGAPMRWALISWTPPQ